MLKGRDQVALWVIIFTFRGKVSVNTFAIVFTVVRQSSWETLRLPKFCRHAVEQYSHDLFLENFTSARQFRELMLVVET